MNCAIYSARLVCVRVCVCVCAIALVQNVVIIAKTFTNCYFSKWRCFLGSCHLRKIVFSRPGCAIYPRFFFCAIYYPPGVSPSTPSWPPGLCGAAPAARRLLRAPRRALRRVAAATRLLQVHLHRRRIEPPKKGECQVMSMGFHVWNRGTP